MSENIKNIFFNKKSLIQIFFVIISALIYSIAMNFFVYYGNIFPGGFSGLSRIIIGIFDKFLNIKISFSFLYFTLNIIPTFLVFKYVGKKFTIFSIIHFSLVSFFTLILPKYFLTSDMLLISVFSGLLAGTSIALALKNNGSSGGSDFVAIFASTRYGITIWSHIMVVNAFILVVAGLLFGWDKALYSIIYQFCNTQVIKALHDRYQYRTLHIFTEKGHEVSSAIFKTVRHGITKIDAQGEYTHKHKDYLFLTINAFQVRVVVKAVRNIDPHAFINVCKTETVIGNYYQIPLD